MPRRLSCEIRFFGRHPSGKEIFSENRDFPQFGRDVRQMIDPATCAFDEVTEDIYAEVVSNDEFVTYPQDTISKLIAGVVQVAYFVDVCYTDGTRTHRPISQRELSRWNVNQDSIEEICAKTSCTIPVEEWDRIGWWGNTYLYPVFDCDWTSVLLNQRELANVPLKGAPLIMIPDPDVALITGSSDFWGVRTLIREAHRLNPNPLTPRPLMFSGSEWIESDEYRRPVLGLMRRMFRNRN